MRKKRILVGTGIAVLLVLAAVFGGSLYMLGYSLRPENRGKDMDASMQYMCQAYPHITSWMDSVALRDTFITASDGVRLHAFHAKAARPTKRTAVIVHGYTDNAIRMLHIGYMYNKELGYNILLPDLRYSGLSEGKAIQMGWLDRKDVLQWIDVAPRLFGDSIEMVVHGISMGAATTMMVSGERTPDYVCCFVEDCGYTSVWDQFGKELKEQFGLPAFPLLYTSSLLCRWMYGWDFREASALAQVEKCTKPMLFIHGSRDDYVPTSMVYRLYAAKPQPKELVVVPKAGHAVSYQLYPEAYAERVQRFVDKYIH